MSLRTYIGFDDTDNQDSDFGTGKIARRFENIMPEGCHMWGVVRQQLLVDERIPYTSHNSSACVVVDISDSSLMDALISMASEYIEREAAPGSGVRDPYCRCCVAGKICGRVLE